MRTSSGGGAGKPFATVGFGSSSSPPNNPLVIGQRMMQSPLANRIRNRVSQAATNVKVSASAAHAQRTTEQAAFRRSCPDRIDTSAEIIRLEYQQEQQQSPVISIPQWQESQPTMVTLPDDDDYTLHFADTNESDTTALEKMQQQQTPENETGSPSLSSSPHWVVSPSLTLSSSSSSDGAHLLQTSQVNNNNKDPSPASSQQKPPAQQQKFPHILARSPSTSSVKSSESTNLNNTNNAANHSTHSTGSNSGHRHFLPSRRASAPTTSEQVVNFEVLYHEALQESQMWQDSVSAMTMAMQELQTELRQKHDECNALQETVKSVSAALKQTEEELERKHVQWERVCLKLQQLTFCEFLNEELEDDDEEEEESKVNEPTELEKKLSSAKKKAADNEKLKKKKKQQQHESNSKHHALSNNKAHVSLNNNNKFKAPAIATKKKHPQVRLDLFEATTIHPISTSIANSGPQTQHKQPISPTTVSQHELMTTYFAADEAAPVAPPLSVPEEDEMEEDGCDEENDEVMPLPVNTTTTAKTDLVVDITSNVKDAMETSPPSSTSSSSTESSSGATEASSEERPAFASEADASQLSPTKLKPAPLPPIMVSPPKAPLASAARMTPLISQPQVLSPTKVAPPLLVTRGGPGTMATSATGAPGADSNTWVLAAPRQANFYQVIMERDRAQQLARDYGQQLQQCQNKLMELQARLNKSIALNELSYVGAAGNGPARLLLDDNNGNSKKDLSSSEEDPTGQEHHRRRKSKKMPSFRKRLKKKNNSSNSTRRRHNSHGDAADGDNEDERGGVGGNQGVLSDEDDNNSNETAGAVADADGYPPPPSGKSSANPSSSFTVHDLDQFPDELFRDRPPSEYASTSDADTAGGTFSRIEV